MSNKNVRMNNYFINNSGIPMNNNGNLMHNSAMNLNNNLTLMNNSGNFMNNNGNFMNNSGNFNNNVNLMNNSGMFMNNNGNSMNNMFNQPMPFNNNLNFFNYMGINNSMNMNMYNLMMQFLFTQYNPANQTFFNNTSNNINKMSSINPNYEEKTAKNPKVFKGLLPREKKTEDYNPFPDNGGNKINLYFQAPTGHKINMLVPDNIQMKEVLVKYVLRIGLEPDVIDNAIYFLYGGNKIKKKERRTIREMYILNGAIIIVIDKKGVIGA